MWSSETLRWPMPRARPSLIYPYPRLSEDLGFQVTEIRLDGVSPSPDPIVLDFHTADLSIVEPKDWEMLLATVEAAVPTDEMARLEDGGADPVIVAVAECSVTNLRVSTA